VQLVSGELFDCKQTQSRQHYYTVLSVYESDSSKVKLNCCQLHSTHCKIILSITVKQNLPNLPYRSKSWQQVRIQTNKKEQCLQGLQSAFVGEWMSHTEERIMHSTQRNS